MTKSFKYLLTSAYSPKKIVTFDSKDQFNFSQLFLFLNQSRVMRIQHLQLSKRLLLEFFQFPNKGCKNKEVGRLDRVLTV